MEVPPRVPDSPIIEPYLVWRILLVSVVMAAGTFGLFFYEYQNGLNLEEARTVAVNTIVFFEIFYLFNMRFLNRSVLSIEGISGNRMILLGAVTVILFQLLFTYWSVFNNLFKTAPIYTDSWLRIITVTVSILFIVELDKLFNRIKINKQNSAPGKEQYGQHK